MYKKIKLHIILPGGGAKGSYQAGFLYTLSKFTLGPEPDHRIHRLKLQTIHRFSKI